MNVDIRVATEGDLAVLRAIMDRAIGASQRALLSPGQVIAGRAVMGLDTQLVRDGAYFVVPSDAWFAACELMATLSGNRCTAGRVCGGRACRGRRGRGRRAVDPDAQGAGASRHSSLSRAPC